MDTGGSSLRQLAFSASLHSLMLRPLLASGLAFAVAARLAFAADTLSIAVMEIVDNAFMLAIPGAMEAGPRAALFWGSLGVALGIAFVAAFPINY